MVSESERSDYIRPDYKKNILLLISNRTVYKLLLYVICIYANRSLWINSAYIKITQGSFREFLCQPILKKEALPFIAINLFIFSRQKLALLLLAFRALLYFDDNRSLCFMKFTCIRLLV